MADTVGQVERDIRRSRAELGSHLRELESRIDAVTDWREQVRARPYLALSLAATAGVLAAHWMRGGASTSHRPRPAARQVYPSPDVPGQMHELWDNVATALVAVAATRLTDYIGHLVPGFADQLRQVSSRPGTKHACAAVMPKTPPVKPIAPAQPSGEDQPETEATLDETLEGTFPASDPPSSNPNPAPPEDDSSRTGDGHRAGTRARHDVDSESSQAR